MPGPPTWIKSLGMFCFVFFWGGKNCLVIFYFNFCLNKICFLLDYSIWTNKSKPSNNTTPVSLKQKLLPENSKSTADLTTWVSKLKPTSIFTTPVPLRHNGNDSNLRLMNLLVDRTYSIIYNIN